jgi:hypothetical protein
VTAGYSGTPLAKKLGYKQGMRLWFGNMPDDVRAEIEAHSGLLAVEAEPAAGLDAAQLFVTRRTQIEQALPQLRASLAPGGFLWVSWPKKAAKMPTDVTEDVIRTVVLPMGFVDVKVCAIDAVWSGLKLMIRRSER